MDGLYLGSQFKTVGATYAYTAMDIFSRKMSIRMTSALSNLTPHCSFLFKKDTKGPYFSGWSAGGKGTGSVYARP